MQIVGKVSDGAYDAVERTIEQSLRETHAGGDAVHVIVKPVFPGLTSGRRAGMFTVDLPDHLSPAIVQSVIAMLRDVVAIEYAEVPAEKSAR